MSTLGDLLAEHAVLPGNAVDQGYHQAAAAAAAGAAAPDVGARSEDSVLVCVAQVRPNTAPTVLLADAVGSLADAGQLPLVTAAFQSGTIGSGRCRARN